MEKRFLSFTEAVLVLTSIFLSLGFLSPAHALDKGEETRIRLNKPWLRQAVSTFLGMNSFPCATDWNKTLSCLDDSEPAIGMISRPFWIYIPNTSYTEDALRAGVGKNIPKAIHERIYRLVTQGGSPQHLAEAKKLNELLVAQNNTQAIVRKINGLSHGHFGYKSAIGPIDGEYEARKIIEGVRKNCEWAIHLKISRLSSGSFGYPKNPKKARQLNEKLIANGSEHAILEKIHQLNLGTDIYSKDIFLARDIIEEGVREGHQWAVFTKMNGLLSGQFGYDQNTQAMLDFAQRHNTYAYHYLSAVGHWIGAFGFKKNAEMAQKIMTKYGITF